MQDRDRRRRDYLRNLRIERDNAALYASLAETARDARIARVYRRIAGREQANAEFWARRLHDELGVEAPMPRAGLRVRVLGVLARWFGTGFVMPTVMRLEHAERSAAMDDRAVDRDPLGVDAQPLRSRHLRAGGGNTL
ncbi:MAG: hypothetical protein JSS21_04305, partial [Proteobacteria bacterium]|nr:hypothetical protein [Pseudomonadota bacterium]